jgi:predicted metal-binding protein
VSLDAVELCARARALGASDAAVIGPQGVVTAEWVRMKCLYGGCKAGLCLTCPPHSPTPTQMRALLDEHQAILVLRFAIWPESTESLPACSLNASCSWPVT